MKWVLILAPLGLVMVMSFGINRLSSATALTLFFVYAGLLGLSLSTIFLVYTGASIIRVFFISAATFGAMSLYGYTTQRDLTGFGSFLFMGLIGIIIASLVNIFLHSSGLDWVISVLGVLIFTGLTAYDTSERQGDVQPDGRRHRDRPQGGYGRAAALSRLHQPLPDRKLGCAEPKSVRSAAVAEEPEQPPGRKPESAENAPHL